ncbi:hypothetical protein GCM10010171_28950 [Actinokineospora fastidiosa]|uniref:Uncharacterized protein n=1 Tax=Actinokineospora fastidiosa TaxID=1816 RepID=A0A918GFV3_9PSEU|nr:hypothetical protein GCM10010171_28950 [Actinokineospora fastidiosa]
MEPSLGRARASTATVSPVRVLSNGWNAKLTSGTTVTPDSVHSDQAFGRLCHQVFTEHCSSPPGIPRMGE